MSTKEFGFREKLRQKIKKLSITTTLIIHISYIGYLAYSLINDVGIKAVNIALIIGTAIFLGAYLFLQLFDKKKNIKSTKQFYKRFKLATKVFSTGTAVYSLVTASNAVSPFAMILPCISAAILAIKIILELIVFLITRQARRVKDSIKHKIERRKNQKVVDAIELSEEEYCAISVDDFE